MKVKEYFKAGLWTDNPVLIQFLGLCPALAITTTTLNAFTMGLCLTLVLIGSNVLIALLRRLIPHHVRIIFYVLIISGLVSLVEMILSTFFNDLYNALGIFVPLIAANGILLARAETFASKNKVLPGLLDGVAMGCGFTIVLVLVGLIREVVGSGTIFGYTLFGGISPLSVFALPAGGFLTLGLLASAAQFFRNRAKRGSHDGTV